MKGDPDGAITRLVDGTQRLQDTGEEATEADLSAYLDDHRPAYELGLSGGWNVGRNFKVALTAAGVTSDLAGIS
jgi:hypothetical protein